MSADKKDEEAVDVSAAQSDLEKAQAELAAAQAAVAQAEAKMAAAQAQVAPDATPKADEPIVVQPIVENPASSVADTQPLPVPEPPESPYQATAQPAGATPPPPASPYQDVPSAGYAQQPNTSAQQPYTAPQQPYSQPVYGTAPAPAYAPPTKDHVAAGLLALFLGTLGVHKFFLGYNTSGFVMLGVTIIGSIFFGIGPMVMFVISVVEGIVYLTKSQPEFEQVYVYNKREWF